MSIRPGQSLSPRLVIVFDRTIMFLEPGSQLLLVLTHSDLDISHSPSDWFGIAPSPHLLDQHWHLHLYLGCGWLAGWTVSYARCEVAIFKFLTKCSILISRKWWGLTGVDWEDTQAGRFCWCWNRTELRTGSNFVYLIILSLPPLPGLVWAGDEENKKMSSHDRSSGW